MQIRINLCLAVAVHNSTNIRVAMKIINRRKIANMEMVGRVKREVEYLKLFRHPHIIKLYEIITTPTDVILVMEYAPNELFNFIVERGRVFYLFKFFTNRCI